MQLAGYLRLSQESDASTSIAKQQERITDDVRRRGLEHEPIEWFIDSGVSGSKIIKRPARDALERRLVEFDLLFVNSIDRLARSTADFIRITDTASKHDCATVVVGTEIDFSTPTGRLLSRIMALLAEYEAGLIAERIQQTNEYLVRSGKRTGGQTPFGLRNVPAPDGRGYVMRPDPETAPLVREAVERFLSGDSLRGIARDWTARDIARPQNGNEWDDTSLSRLLKRPALAGLRVFRGSLVRDPETGLPRVDPEAAILSRQEWATLQETFKARAVPGQSPRSARSALLAGLLRCPEGRPLYLNISRTVPCYVCKCNGNTVSIRAEAVEPLVEREFLARFGQLERTLREITEGRDWAAVSEVQSEIQSVSDALRIARGPERLGLFDTLTALQETEDRLLSEATEPVLTLIPTGFTIGETWEVCDLAERRDLLSAALEGITISKASRRGVVDLSRVLIEWRHDYEPTLADLE